jgi:hypothetical protein
MRRKPKPRKIPIVNKEYIWTLDVDNDIHEYKVFLGEDECITYEDGVESKRLKIVDKTQMPGVIQIDCKTKVFDDGNNFVAAEADTDRIPDIRNSQHPINLNRNQYEQQHQSFLAQPFQAIPGVVGTGRGFGAFVKHQCNQTAGNIVNGHTD